MYDMKRTIIPLLLAAFFSVGLVSCQHQTMTSIEFSVRHNEWHEENGMQVYTFYWPELDADVVDFGSVNVYMLDHSGAQNQLPFVYKQDYVDDDGEVYYVPENVSYAYGYGYLTLIIEDLDNNTAAPANDNWGSTMTFRAVALGD